ncbi:hypothetical protein [Herbiconiux sp.]|uniref:hypothetical protein n=1 Tax=Herbiconiux sp. TaxID=1871186 RepID=UPI0025C30B8D|nr:hypothetical protein [Herbiconiux sp.]
MTPSARVPRPQRRAYPGVAALRVAGITCISLAITTFALGLLIYLSGYEVAFLLLIVALGAFVLSIGLLAAARRLT